MLHSVHFTLLIDWCVGGINFTATLHIFYINNVNHFRRVRPTPKKCTSDTMNFKLELREMKGYQHHFHVK